MMIESQPVHKVLNIYANQGSANADEPLLTFDASFCADIALGFEYKIYEGRDVYSHYRTNRMTVSGLFDVLKEGTEHNKEWAETNLALKAQNDRLQEVIDAQNDNYTHLYEENQRLVEDLATANKKLTAIAHTIEVVNNLKEKPAC